MNAKLVLKQVGCFQERSTPDLAGLGRGLLLAITLDRAQMTFAPGGDAQSGIFVGRDGLPVSFKAAERPPS